MGRINAVLNRLTKLKGSNQESGRGFEAESDSEDGEPRRPVQGQPDNKIGSSRNAVFASLQHKNALAQRLVDDEGYRDFLAQQEAADSSEAAEEAGAQHGHEVKPRRTRRGSTTAYTVDLQGLACKAFIDIASGAGIRSPALPGVAAEADAALLACNPDVSSLPASESLAVRAPPQLSHLAVHTLCRSNQMSDGLSVSPMPLRAVGPDSPGSGASTPPLLRTPPSCGSALSPSSAAGRDGAPWNSPGPPSSTSPHPTASRSPTPSLQPHAQHPDPWAPSALHCASPRLSFRPISSLPSGSGSLPNGVGSRRPESSLMVEPGPRVLLTSPPGSNGNCSPCPSPLARLPSLLSSGPAAATTTAPSASTGSSLAGRCGGQRSQSVQGMYGSSVSGGLGAAPSSSQTTQNAQSSQQQHHHQAPGRFERVACLGMRSQRTSSTGATLMGMQLLRATTTPEDGLYVETLGKSTASASSHTEHCTAVENAAPPDGDVSALSTDNEMRALQYSEVSCRQDSVAAGQLVSDLFDVDIMEDTGRWFDAGDSSYCVNSHEELAALMEDESRRNGVTRGGSGSFSMGISANRGRPLLTSQPSFTYARTASGADDAGLPVLASGSSSTTGARRSMPNTPCGGMVSSGRGSDSLLPRLPMPGSARESSGANIRAAMRALHARGSTDCSSQDGDADEGAGLQPQAISGSVGACPRQPSSQRRSSLLLIQAAGRRASAGWPSHVLPGQAPGAGSGGT